MPYDFIENEFKNKRFQRIVDNIELKELPFLGAYSFNLHGLSTLVSPTGFDFDAYQSLNLPQPLVAYRNLYLGGYYYKSLSTREKGIELIKSSFRNPHGLSSTIDGKRCSWIAGASSFHNFSKIDKVPELEFDYYGGTPASRELLLVSADSAYFKKYFKSLVGKARLTSSSMLVNIINPDSEVTHFLDKNLAHYNSLGVFFSISNGDANKWYYTISRFLLAQKIKSDQSFDVLLIDIDSALGDVDKAFETLSNFDVAYRLKNSCLPWQKIQANRVYINRSESACAFLDAVVDYIKSTYSPKHDQWFIDQNALEYANSFFTASSGPFSHGNIDSMKHVRQQVVTLTGVAKKQLIDPI